MRQVVQGSCACPMIRNVQGQVVWASEQPDLLKDVPAHGKRVGCDDL